ncbi:class I SAM-dependent methyltransferase [Nocardia bovistercoris]|uniref:Class I SAM-dependent methyltransferase n=1 Tax=Nocardia bovistercoris TaxID=2785916 RepID=A0A931I906_9NOCA|nr:class I SAM-dependent methyltransferase [Nocardia bovistercoris]MBH0775937.1 class I SAM-dependent methyltransferase [Nocardia bovistercoris]
MSTPSTPDPFRGRRPTSHERLAGVPWDDSYRDGPAPWEIDGPQPAVVRAAAAGEFTGSVLDAGCGSGDNALRLAELGLSVVGVDVAETALAAARDKADALGLTVEFAAVDALHLEQLGRTFDTVLDCGLFHTFDGAERRDYVTSLAAVTARGGIAHILCFGDEGDDLGPHPVSRADLIAAFDTGWTVRRIALERVMTRFHPDGASAWFATMVRA